MEKRNVKIITSAFALSILSLLAIISTIIITFALNLSGFNLQVGSSSCGGKAYFVAKSSALSVILKVHTVTGLLSVCLAILILILVIQLYWPLRSRSSHSEQQKQSNNFKIIALYLLASCECLCMISNGAGHLSLLIDNNSCSLLDKPALIGLTVTSMVALLAALAIQVLVLLLYSYLSSGQQISLRDLRNSEMSRQEEAMSKQFQKQMKQYYSNNPTKDEMMEGLLKAEQQIYAKKEEDETMRPHQAIPEGDTQALNIANHNNQVNANKKKSVAAVMHSYHNQVQREEEQYIVPTPKQQQQEEIMEVKIDEKLLYAQEEDNLSEKFEQNNFQLDYDLQRAKRFQKDEDLSPFERRQQMNFHKAQFKHTSENQTNLLFEKTYDEPEGFVIRINFIKIKKYKQHLKDQIEKLEKQPSTDETTQTTRKDEKKGAEDIEEELPLTEQTARLLKKILFDHSEFYKKQPEKQGCPIGKYIENDEGFEVIQSNEKEGKNKRAEYSKEQLLFSKKRKDISEEHQKEKATMREEFNELQFIKIQRKAIFGEEGERVGKDGGEGKKFGKLKKRKLVQVIRSKYYQ